jgi:hypothetical protein
MAGKAIKSRWSGDSLKFETSAAGTEVLTLDASDASPKLGDGFMALGVAKGYAIARGVHTTVTASDTVVTGLDTVVAIVATPASDLDDELVGVTATIGDQAGSPAAGSVYIKSWKNTSGTDPTPVAATTFSKTVNWVAIGTV